MGDEDNKLPVTVIEPEDEAPVKVISASQLASLGQNLNRTFAQYASDRRVVELRWVRALRQYLGIYDPEIERELGANRSRAYPRITRVKCISVLSRIMNLMFPGNERNWQLNASPSADMDPHDVQEALKSLIANRPQGEPSGVGFEDIEQAVQDLATKRAEKLALVLDDQLQELGGDQTLDYVSLNRKVAQSGIMYGLGVLRGPFVREAKSTKWQMAPGGMPVPVEHISYKPQYDFLPVWDFYPDLSAKTFASMDGYFIRMVLSRPQLRALAKRSDFFGQQIKDYLNANSAGNYKPREFETDLRSMGVKEMVNDQKADRGKYEIIVWNGPVSGEELILAGVDVPPENRADDIEAEVWMVDGKVIRADMNAWRKLGVEVRTIHTFLFDEDDTSPVGNGLPDVVRDSAMSVAASARMLLDNASVVCGPNLEVNTDLVRQDQDLTSVSAYKIWYREGVGQEAQFPAVRQIPIDGHLSELKGVIDLFMQFADMETFVGPATGGDVAQAPSEPMRTAAGASMMRSDAALPFKDIVRSYDFFTQSVIMSMVQFNRKFNPELAPPGDYNVIARGATSLIAKEVRGMQVDQLAATLTPEERDHVDERKFVEARFSVRDMGDMLVSKAEAGQRQAARAEQQQKQIDQQAELTQAEIRKTLADAFKGVAQGKKNAASADAAAVSAAIDIMERGIEANAPETGTGSSAEKSAG